MSLCTAQFCCEDGDPRYHLDMPCTAAIYARTSLDCPLSAEAQVDRLKTVAAERGWTVTTVFTDRPTSARKSREKRPGEAALLDAIRRGEVQKVMMLGLDRVGRSLAELVTFVEVCRVAGINLWLDNERIDTASANGLSLFDVAAMMAHHARQTHRDRVLRGQAAARSLDVRFGRPPLPAARVTKAKMLLVEGKGVREAARMAGISAASVSRLKAVSAPVEASS